MMIDLQISEQLLGALGHALVHSLWQFTLLAFLGASVKRFRIGLNKSSKYLVSFALLLVCGLCFGATFSHYYHAAIDSEIIAAERPDIQLQPQPKSEDNRAGQQVAALHSFQQRWSDYLPSVVQLWMLGVLILTLKQVAEYSFLRHLRHYGVQAPSENRMASFDALQQNLASPVRYRSLPWSWLCQSKTL